MKEPIKTKYDNKKKSSTPLNRKTTESKFKKKNLEFKPLTKLPHANMLWLSATLQTFGNIVEHGEHVKCHCWMKSTYNCENGKNNNLIFKQKCLISIRYMCFKSEEEYPRLQGGWTWRINSILCAQYSLFIWWAFHFFLPSPLLSPPVVVLSQLLVANAHEDSQWNIHLYAKSF